LIFRCENPGLSGVFILVHGTLVRICVFKFYGHFTPEEAVLNSNRSIQQFEKAISMNIPGLEEKLRTIKQQFEDLHKAANDLSHTMKT